MVSTSGSSAHPGRRLSLSILMCGAMWACPASAAAAAAWSTQQVPHPKVAVGSALFDVSCRSTVWCIAVGGASATPGQLFADRWNGHAWSLLHPPLPSGASQSHLGGISCASTRVCVAVGTFVRGGRDVPLAERWNGRRWSMSVLPKPPGTLEADLEAVSCVSAGSCLAVGASYNRGGDSQAVVEQMRGSRWRLRPLSGPGKRSGVAALAGVSCTSITVCTAVGYDDAGDGIALRWNARGWRFQFDSDPNLWAGSELYGVSCVSSTVCAAAGGGNDSNSAGEVSNTGVAEMWNGTKWTIREDTDPTSTINYDLFAVSRSSRIACLAVGFIAEQWNGRTWTPEHIPDPVTLLGVSCPTRTLCFAVGDSTARRGPAEPIVMRWSVARRRNVTAQPIHNMCRVPRSCGHHHAMRSGVRPRRLRPASCRRINSSGSVRLVACRRPQMRPACRQTALRFRIAPLHGPANRACSQTSEIVGNPER